MSAVDRDPDEDSRDSVDHLIVSLRAYVTRAPTKAKRSKGEEKPGQRPAGKKQFPPRIPPSDWVLVFDCETRTTPDRRLRFGAYQLRNKGRLFERGAFYEPEVLSAEDLTVLSKVVEEESETSDGERVRLLTRDQFVDSVLYGSGRDVGAQIVGFNLPFDISRLAIDHASARRSIRGGFSFQLSGKEGRANVAIKHLSQKAALIRFTGEKSEKTEEVDEIDPDTPHESEEPGDPDRGYFVDVKTLAAALTSSSHSLASLSELLDVPTKKADSEEHGGPLTPDYVRYGLRDVQTTWECFDALAQRFTSFGLDEAGAYDLYSEASLGKAYLKTMKIARWRDLQPKFPPQMIGQILSAYYGGRAEVHIRRQIVPVIHCDFLSMYPTVCTLMGLWNFVRARGVIYREDTERVRAMIATPREELAEQLRHKPIWSELTALVQVAPDRDLFPVRAKYPDAETANIGLNELSSDDPIWFTLADVLAAKVLTRRTPTIVKAIRFDPKGKQAGLKPVVVAGETIDPTTQDFYRQLIIHRNKLKAEAKSATGATKAALESDQQAIKILANATSYGIFVELNVEDYKTAKTMIANGAEGQPFEQEFAEQTFKQLEGFGSYGFPESHAASFALIAYASSWVKCWHPDIFCATLLNSQPMGFYAPAQIVRDAQAHGVEIRPICINASRWDCTLEPTADEGLFAVRLGMRMVKGLADAHAAAILAARADRPFQSVDDLWRRAGVPSASLVQLAEADAFLPALGLVRREALWAIKALRDEPLPLFAAAAAREDEPVSEIIEPIAALRPMTAGSEVVEDYGHVGLTLRQHPVTFLRGDLAARRIVTCTQAMNARDGRWLEAAGLVLVRQRPGSAKGVMFITLEDETGIANPVVWPQVFETFRRVVMSGSMIAVRGRIQREGEVVHLVAHRLVDLSAELATVGSRDAAFPLSHGRGDETTHAGGGPDPREHSPKGWRTRDIYVPDLHIDSSSRRAGTSTEAGRRKPLRSDLRCGGSRETV